MADKSTAAVQKADSSRTESRDSNPASVSDAPGILAQPESQEPTEQPARQSTSARSSMAQETGEVVLQFPPKMAGRVRTGFIRRAKGRKDAPKSYGRLYYKACMSMQLMCSCVTTRVCVKQPRYSIALARANLWRFSSSFLLRIIHRKSQTSSFYPCNGCIERRWIFQGALITWERTRCFQSSS